MGAVDFNEELHQYTDELGTLVSATQLIGKYKQPFDAPVIAKRYAEKRGQTPEYWLAQWDSKREKACDRGTIFHNIKEELALGTGFLKVGVEFREVKNPDLQSQAWKTFDLYQLVDGVYVELRLWHHGYRVAGTADVVNIESIGDVRYVDIDDHKTNGKIDTRSYYSTYTEQYKMMKPPLAHLMDCNFQHYELQISLYAFMLECFGFIPRHLTFTHYPQPDEEDPFKDTTPVKFPLTYRRDEVILMMTDNYKRWKEEQRKTR